MAFCRSKAILFFLLTSSILFVNRALADDETSKTASVQSTSSTSQTTSSSSTAASSTSLTTTNRRLCRHPYGYSDFQCTVKCQAWQTCYYNYDADCRACFYSPILSWITSTPRSSLVFRESSSSYRYVSSERNWWKAVVGVIIIGVFFAVIVCLIVARAKGRLGGTRQQVRPVQFTTAYTSSAPGYGGQVNPAFYGQQVSGQTFAPGYYNNSSSSQFSSPSAYDTAFTSNYTSQPASTQYYPYPPAQGQFAQQNNQNQNNSGFQSAGLSVPPTPEPPPYGSVVPAQGACANSVGLPQYGFVAASGLQNSAQPQATTSGSTHTTPTIQ